MLLQLCSLGSCENRITRCTYNIMDGAPGMGEMEANETKETQEQNPRVRSSVKGSLAWRSFAAPGLPPCACGSLHTVQVGSEAWHDGKNGKLREAVFAHLRDEGIHFELRLQAIVQEKSSDFCQRLNQPYVEEQQFHRHGVENTSHYGLIFLNYNYPERQITREWPSLAMCS